MYIVRTAYITTMSETEDLRAKIKQLEETLQQSKDRVEELDRRQMPMVINRDKKISNFSGKEVEEWIDSVQNYVERLPTEPQKVRFIVDHLDRHPKAEIRLRINTDKATSKEVFKVLAEVFSDRDTTVQLQQKFFSRDQKKDETLVNYSCELMEMMINLKSKAPKIFIDTDSILKERFAEGVKDVQLRRELRRLNTEQPTLMFWELRDRAASWIEEDAPTKVGHIRSQETVTTSEAVMTDMMKLLEDHKKQLQELSAAMIELKTDRSGNRRWQGGGATRTENQRGSNAQFTCHYCKGPNHIARNCFKRKRDIRLGNQQQAPQLGQEAASNQSSTQETSTFDESNFRHSASGARY